jgi:hypothetical protein
MLRQLSLACIGFALFCLPAQGYTLTTGGSSVLNGTTPVSNQGLFSTVANVTTIDFNSGSAPSTGVAQYSQTNNVVSGSGGQYAQPPSDNTPYFTVGPSINTTATITFTQTINYFGFYASTLDSYNSIQFLSGSTVLATLTGTDISTLAGGNSGYINFYSSNNGQVFNKIILSSTSFAFETDNHAYRIGSTAQLPVPEPSPMLPALLTFGLGALLARIYKSRIRFRNVLVDSLIDHSVFVKSIVSNTFRTVRADSFSRNQTISAGKLSNLTPAFSRLSRSEIANIR